MNGVMKKLAALILAVAMITTFTPLYGAGAIAYAEDETVAAQQDNAAAENEDPAETAAGDENLAPAEGTEVTGTEGAEEDVSSGDDGEGVVQEDPAVEDSGNDEEVNDGEVPEVDTEEKLPAMEGAEGNLRGDDDDPFADVYQTGLEGPNIIFNDGLAEYRLTDQEALNVEGVTHYEAFVGVPGPDGWDAVDPACYSYDDSTKTVTVDGRVLEQKHPDYMIDKRLAVQIIGLDDEDNFKMIASKMDVDFWPTYSRYDLPEDREVLPGWDGSIDGRVHYYVENSEYPDGYDTNLNVEDVEVIEGGDLLEEWHYDEDDNNHWWYYRAGRNLGNVTFRMTYRDVDGSTKTHDVHVSIGGDVYRVDLYVDGNIDKLLPGQEVTLHAWPGHEFWTGENGGYTSEGMKLDWSLIRNDNDAGELIVDENDPGTARLRIREPEDGEEILAGIRVKVAVYDENDPDVEKASQERFFEASQDFYDIHPTDLNFNMPLGSSFTQKFELHHYTFRDGRPNDDILPATKARFDYNEEAFKITKEGYAEQLASGEEVTDCDTFTIQRTREFGGDINLTLWGEDNIQCHKRYWFADMNYDLWFDNHDLEIFTDTQNDPQFRVDIGTFQTGGDIDENFTINVKAGEWDNNADDFASMLPEDAFSQERDGQYLVLTFDRTKLGLDRGKDIRIVAEAVSRQMDDWRIERDAWIHVREAKYEFHTENHMEMLPGWDNNLDWIDVYIENEDHPDGEDFHFPVKNVAIVSGAEHLDEMPTAENNWYFRVKDSGQVLFDLTYDNEYGVEEHFPVEVNITGDVYEIWMGEEGPFNHGLPGTSLDLYAYAVHKYLDNNGHYHEENEGLIYEWGFEFGEEYATLTQDSKDPTHAVLTFKDMPDGRDHYHGEMLVVVRVKDANNEPDVERASSRQDFWVDAEFNEVWPVGQTRALGIGKSTGDIKYEVRKYSVFGTAEDGYEDGCKTYDIERTQWFFNEDDLTITGKDGQVHDGNEVAGDTFDIFRKTANETNAHLHVRFTDDNGHTEDCDGNVHFDHMNYDMWLDSIDDGVYVDKDCVVELRTDENLDYSALDIRYVVGYDEWNEEEQEDHWFDAPQDCYSVSDDRMSITIFGAAMSEHGIEELRIRPEAWYDGEKIREGDERSVWRRDSCQDWGEEHLWLTSPPEYEDCESEGTQRMMCWNCHQKKIVTVPPRGHVAKAVKEKAATATAEGNIKYWKCSFCGKCFTDSKCTKEISEDGTKIPKGMSLSKVTPQKKGLTATWKAPTGKDLAHTSGYEIMIALNSKFTSGKKTVKITSPKTASKKITGLTGGKKYYVKIRKYRTIAGKKYYSPWSKSKSTTTKK